MKLFRRLFFESYWCCAYRVTDEKDFLIKPREKTCYKVISIPDRYWIADPFVFEHSGRLCLFVEMYDRYKTKAAIGMMEYINKQFSEIKPIYEFDCHTSYPCIFEYEDVVYMIPETKANHEIVLLKCDNWPDVWTEDTILLKNIDAVDTTVFKFDDGLKLFIYEMANGGNANLYISDLNMEKRICKNRILIHDYHDYLGRPGGGVFEDDCGYCRVVQQGNNFYGERLEIYRFDLKQDGTYKECFIDSFDVNAIETDSKKKFSGIHTINRYKQMEVVDLLVLNEFKLLKPVIRIFKIIGIPPFYMGDKKRKKCFCIKA